MFHRILEFGRIVCDPEGTRFLGWPPHRSVRDTETFLQFSAQEWSDGRQGPT